MYCKNTLLYKSYHYFYSLIKTQLKFLNKYYYIDQNRVFYVLYFIKHKDDIEMKKEMFYLLCCMIQKTVKIILQLGQ